jgi:phosphatidylinositol 4-kinase A
MAKIQIDVGVYLPSNPDGKVVDIDKKSGRPLQSHAKVEHLLLPRVGLDTVFIGAIYGDVQSTKTYGGY